MIKYKGIVYYYARIRLVWRNRKMKRKFLSLLLVTACVLSLAACGSKKDDSSSGDSGNKKEDTLVMATNAEFPPYEYYEGKDVVGIDADIAAAVADELGMKLKIEDMAFDSIIAAVSSGKADIGAAGMTVTEERLKNVDFTDTYATATQVIIVTEDSEIAGPDDLTGKKIGVQLGTTGDIYADDIEDASVERYNKGFEAVQALQQGKIDAVIIDGEPAKEFVKEADGLKILDEAFTEEEYAIAVKKGNDELKDKINDALASLKDSGKLDEIVGKYISSDSDK
jgi:polar amino acid transport system substrate-binding protein